MNERQFRQTLVNSVPRHVRASRRLTGNLSAGVRGTLERAKAASGVLCRACRAWTEICPAEWLVGTRVVGFSDGELLVAVAHPAIHARLRGRAAEIGVRLRSRLPGLRRLRFTSNEAVRPGVSSL